MMNDLPKVVFSRKPQKLDWKNSRLARGSAAEEIAKLKAVIGRGLPLFKDADRTKLTLRQARQFRSGNVLLYYEPVRVGRRAQ